MRIVIPGNSDANNDEVGQFLASGGDPTSLRVDYGGPYTRLVVEQREGYYVARMGGYYLFTYRSNEYAIRFPSGEYRFVGMSVGDKATARTTIDGYIASKVEELNALAQYHCHHHVAPAQVVITPPPAIPQVSTTTPVVVLPPPPAAGLEMKDLDAIVQNQVLAVLAERERIANEAEEARLAKEKEEAREREFQEMREVIEQLKKGPPQAAATSAAAATTTELAITGQSQPAAAISWDSILTVDRVLLVGAVIFVCILLLNQGHRTNHQQQDSALVHQQNQIFQQMIEKLQPQQPQQAMQILDRRPVDYYSRRAPDDGDYIYDDEPPQYRRHSSRKQGGSKTNDQGDAAAVAPPPSSSSSSTSWYIVLVFVAYVAYLLWSRFSEMANKEKRCMELRAKLRSAKTN